MGRDEEQSLDIRLKRFCTEIWNDIPYVELREGHKTGNYPDYCKDCDFLLDDPEVLVWTNHERDLYKMHGTRHFDLDDYREKPK